MRFDLYYDRGHWVLVCEDWGLRSSSKRLSLLLKIIKRCITEAAQK